MVLTTLKQTSHSLQLFHLRRRHSFLNIKNIVIFEERLCSFDSSSCSVSLVEAFILHLVAVVVP